MSVVAAPFLLLAVTNYALPAVDTLLHDRFGGGVVPYYPVIVAMFTTLIPVLFGMVGGFVLLDERDAGIFVPISVSPIGIRGWLVWKLSVTTAVSAPMSGLFALLNGVVPVSASGVWAVTVGALLQTPAYALILSAYAADKVSGVALGKALALVVAAPIIIWFAPSPWPWFAAVLPSFWSAAVVLAPWRTPLPMDIPIGIGTLTGAAVARGSAAVIAALTVHGAWLLLPARRLLRRRHHGDR